MSMALRIAGSPITLDALRTLVAQTEGWPGESTVQPKGSRSEPASITVSQPDDVLPLAGGTA